jgi:hypothetical protein
MRRSAIAAVTVTVTAAAAVLPLVPALASTSAGTGFTADVTNPYFPLQPGMRWVYRGVKDGKAMRDVVTVPGRVKRIDGVPCAVVLDRAYLDGHLAERTTDWYTQDVHGTVWYYGEATAELDARGRVTSREGSWRDGRQGAHGGVFMPAHPKVGQSFTQEHFAGHAEDHFKVAGLRATIRVPYGTFRQRSLTTHEWTPLEPGVLDGKWYVRGIGEVAEKSLKGPVERAELVAFRRR